MLTCFTGGQLGFSWTCLTLTLVLLTFGSKVLSHSQQIETQLLAKWAPTSLLSEACEYVGDVDGGAGGLYWKYLEHLWDKYDSFGALEDLDQFESNLATVAGFGFLSPAQLRMMEWSLSARAYSPQVHMFQELAPETKCPTFVHYGQDQTTCNPEELQNLISTGKIVEYQHTVVTEADHKYPSFIWGQTATGTHSPIAILYGHPSSALSRKFHEILKTNSDQIGYIYRPYKISRNGTLLLSGYGAELQFKSTEYKAQDDSGKSAEDKPSEVAGFLFEKLNELHPDSVENLEKFQNHLASQKSKKAGFEALKAWQVQELGLQASYSTTLQPNVLESLMDLSGNFPSRAGSLSSIKVPSDFKKAILHNQKLLQSHFNVDDGDGALFLQGNYIDPDSMDIFTFIDSLQVELDLMETMQSIYHEKGDHNGRTDVHKLLQIGSRSSSDPDLALDLRDSSVYWINDLENDDEYEDWPDDLTQLFFRMGGVMLRPVRRNVFNLLLTLNPEDVEYTGALLKLAQSFLQHKAPVRIGLVFCADKEIQSNSILESNGDIIRKVFNYAVTEQKIKKAFNLVVEAYASNNFGNLLEKFYYPGEEFEFGSALSCEFVKKSGRPTPAAFLNGVPLKWDSVDDFEEVVLNQLLKEAQTIQIEAYNGKIGDDTDVFEYIMNKPNVQTRLNDKILDTTNAKYVSFGNEIWESGKIPKHPVAKVATGLSYLVSLSKKKLPISISQWILADVHTEDGRNFLQNALNFLQESSTHSRVAFVPTGKKGSGFEKKLAMAFGENDLKSAIRLVQDYKEETEETNIESENSEEKEEILKLIGFPAGSKGVIVNGRILGPLPLGETFDLGDWALIEKISYDGCGKFFQAEEDPSISMRSCSVLNHPKIKSKNSKRFTLPEFQSPVIVNVPKDEANDPFYVDLTAIIDPASRNAHKMSSILNAVQELVGQWVKISIIFNPPPKHSELPLKSYYRFIAGNRPEETIIFENIPREPLFTQNLIAPDNWMVEVVKGENDLDNIILKNLPGSISSEYELANLLVEGHCLEVKTGSPPRGLQFTLKSMPEKLIQSETIVMANLGYFQLKAQPGVWKLDLRDGPSREIFALEASNTEPIVVSSFQSVVNKVKVKRNPGKDSVSLLESEEESATGSWFGFGGGTKNEAQDEDTINVFSLASGHLYERLLKIMMLSVLKNTKSKVKFWFLKNYLSPTLKDVLPHMAKEYNFEYELVQYHWPRWLNPQREKQRIIWGYKILFLDVLFPLSLKKIVFVDADQIVRTDLKELFELDLEGNPYGYTPFCDSRTEMDGFRFWNQGYWRSHLGKRKYHISALYVIDLVRFRRIAAGDRLRGQYQALSQDPNSLSNLDQDLPNNMIHQVGIKSLPQEWLWCETWCDDASKAKAKTIDLCNNPLTKESKLDAAQRIVPEWKDYDTEIREFQQRLRDKGEELGGKEDKHDEL